MTPKGLKLEEILLPQLFKCWDDGVLCHHAQPICISAGCTPLFSLITAQTTSFGSSCPHPICIQINRNQQVLYIMHSNDGLMDGWMGGWVHG